MNRFKRVSWLTLPVRLSAALICAALICFAAFGQTDVGSIVGTITDASGASVTGAKIVAKSQSTGLTREVTSNSSGSYNLQSLRPDVYELKIEASGFESVVRRVEVTVGATNEISVQLAIGKATTLVEVNASSSAVAVNTQDQTLSQVISSGDIQQLPTSPTRNPYALVGTAGNVAEDTMSNRGAGYAINGMRSASTNILLDGSENVDAFTSSVGQRVPLDSVQEFSVLTNNFTAEFGRASGGVVNLVTKSGTNSFHGSAYEFNRISALSSNTEQNDATDTPKGVFTRNNFGFALGGPVKKDKLFFFSNTEWIRVRSSSPTTFTVIDPGSYASLAPASQAFFSAYGKLAPNVALTPIGACSPGIAVNCDTAIFNVPADAGGGFPQNTWEEVARVDYNITNRTTLFVRYAAYHELDFDGTVNSSPYAGYNTGQFSFDQNYEGNLVHVFSPTIVNTTKIVFNRLKGPVQGLGTNPVSPTLYTSASIPSVNGVTLVFPGYSETTPGNAIPFGGPQNLYEGYNDVSITQGRHQLKFGGEFIQLRDNRVFGAYENPTEELGTNLATGLTNLIAGNIYQFQGAVYPQGEFPCAKDATGATIVTPACTLTLPVGPPAFNRNYRYNDGAIYAQDSIKVVPRFTLNLGVRWELYGVQHNANQALDSNFVFGSGANEFEQIRNGSVQLAKNGGYFWAPNLHNFGPRVGFAWDVFGNGKTSLRGGYAISYERNFGNVTYNAIQNPPNYAVVSLISGVDVPGSLPVFTDVAGPLAGTGTKALPAVSQRAIDQNLQSAYAETFDLSVDRSVGRGVFSVAYSGSHGIHLYDISNINVAGTGSTFLGDARAANRLNYQYSNMNFRSDHGYSHYNALNLKYQINNLRNEGLNVAANYTYSHSLDNLSSTFSDGTASNYGLGYLDAFNPKLNYGNSDFDIRHRLNVAASWDMPWLRHSENHVLRAVVGGWGMGTIFNIRTGLPFTLYDCSNFNGTSCPLWAPGQAVARTGSSVATGGNLFNYIALPNVGGVPVNLGDSQGIPICTGLFHTGCSYTADGAAYPDRNQFGGPGYWNIDANFYKTFQLTERFGLQFRAEMYNILNHSNAYVNAGNQDVSSMATPFVQTEKGGIFGTAGQPTDERRNIQFGLRLTF
ncbi:MAG: TonB-dependent receptor [Acidobacteria bacterium]|nr:TonB-dependent receptor [Acidobacteriota bacterium]